MREHPDLPPNPCANVDFHGTRRRRVEASASRLREWGRAVLTLSPVMRDLQLFMLLTGRRRGASIEASRAAAGPTAELPVVGWAGSHSPRSALRSRVRMTLCWRGESRANQSLET